MKVILLVTGIAAMVVAWFSPDVRILIIAYGNMILAIVCHIDDKIKP